MMRERIGLSAVKAGITLPRFFERYQQWSALRELLRRLSIDCVLDVGANRGQFASRLRMSGYAGHIHSFEPCGDDFRFLAEASREDACWHTHNYALGGENATRVLNITRSTILNSFLSPVERAASPAPALGAAVMRTEPVAVRRLDGVLDELLTNIGAPRVFLKSDTQGYDLEVVKGAGPRIGLISGLQAELSVSPIYVGAPHYLEALQHYESLGFSLIDLFVINRTQHHSVLEYDCLMARTERLT